MTTPSPLNNVITIDDEEIENHLGSVQNLSHFRLAERHPALAHAVIARPSQT